MEDQTPIRTLEASRLEALDARDQSLTQLTFDRLAQSRDHIEASHSLVRGLGLISASTQGAAPAGVRAWQLLAPPLSPLIDRTQELENIRTRLVVEDVRLLTLCGPAGVGKTSLALAAVTELAQSFFARIVAVDLAYVRDPWMVLPALSRALGVSYAAGVPLLERLRRLLKGRATLLLLDNFEHVLPEAVQLVNLLAVCPGIRLLVTSRIPLQVRAEHIMRIEPLPVPDLSRPLPPAEELARVPSVALFLERARARQADFTLTEAKARLVAELVVHLDGLPLALELAAARLDTLALPVLVRLLGNRLELLASPAPDAPERQRSLEAAVEWSYELLGPEERRHFRHLGVFVGRVTSGATAAVLGDDPPDAPPVKALGGVVSLAEKSLIMAVPDEEDEDEHGLPAFRVLESLREYAREQLEQAGELEAAEQAHARYFLAFAERADAALRGLDQRAWYLRLEQEHDNLRAALRWLLDREEPVERKAGLRLAGALGWFWWTRGYYTEGARWLEQALARAPRADEEDPAEVTARITALCWAGALLMRDPTGELEQARARLEEALSLAQRRDPTDLARALTFLGLCAVYEGKSERGLPLLREAVLVARSLSEPHQVGIALFYLGIATYARGHTDETAAHYSEALGLFETAGDARAAGAVYIALGVMSGQRDDLPSALLHLRTTLEASKRLRDPWLLGLSARATLAIVGAKGNPVGCARLQGAADALRQATGGERILLKLPEADRIAMSQRATLSEERWMSAYRQGQAMPLDEVAALALAVLDEAAQAQESVQPEPVPMPGPEATGAAAVTLAASFEGKNSGTPLTEREREVLRLVAQGFGNKAIAHQLIISPSTVNYHLIQVFNKLVVDTRAQAVAVAAQRGLL